MVNKKTFETELMISNASGLRYIASELNCKYPASLEKFDMDISTGYFQAAPVLWALGIEIALKAWICRETNRKPPKSHDLLKLLQKLDSETQELLEDAWQRGRGKGTNDDPIIDMARLPRTREDFLNPRPCNLSEALEEHRCLFVNWRYLHENPLDKPYHKVLDRVLKVLICTYRRLPS